MMVRRALLRPAKLDYARPDRAPGRAAVRPPRLRGRRLGVRRDAARDRADRLPARGSADRDGRPGLRRHPVRRLDRRAGADRRCRHATLAGLRHGLWWFHGLLAITFVASIPYTKAAHMLTSFFSLVAARPAGRQAAARRSRPSAPPSRPATRRSPTSARCTCSSSTRARSAGAATRRAPRTRPGGRCRRAT